MPQEAAASIGLEGIALALMEREGTLVERIEPGVATALGSAEASWPAPNSLATACMFPVRLAASTMARSSAPRNLLKRHGRQVLAFTLIGLPHAHFAVIQGLLCRTGAFSSWLKVV